MTPTSPTFQHQNQTEIENNEVMNNGKNSQSQVKDVHIPTYCTQSEHAYADSSI